MTKECGSWVASQEAKAAGQESAFEGAMGSKCRQAKVGSR